MGAVPRVGREAMLSRRACDPARQRKSVFFASEVQRGPSQQQPWLSSKATTRPSDVKIFKTKPNTP
jgi:hypothetical protein